VVGAVAIVVLTACFPQDELPFSSVWHCGAPGALSSPRCCATLPAYAAALAGSTAAIIASDQLGATGGVNGEAFMLAVSRASEICIGIVCAGIVFAGTDLGAARRRLARLCASISAEIAGRFADTLSRAGPELVDTQPIRRGLTRRSSLLTR